MKDVDAMVRILTKLVAMLFLVVAGAWGSSAEAQAACTLNDHCYGEAYISPSGLIGVHATIDPYYLASADNAITTDEIWLGERSAYWVEVGYISNWAKVDGIGHGLSIFWFDSRPGGSAHGHVFDTEPALSSRTFSIYRSATNTYKVSDGTHSDTSTSNSMKLQQAVVGSETSTDDGCSRSKFSSMGYKSGSSWKAFDSSVNTVWDSPQSLVWKTKYTSMEAGVWCT